MIKESGINKDNFYSTTLEGYHKDWEVLFFKQSFSGMVKLAENEYLKPVSKEIKRKCFYPFYKMFIDFDGKFYSAQMIGGRINIVEMSIKKA